MPPLSISEKVRKKLADKHQVTEDEIRQCFVNIDADYDYIEEVRQEHKTDPPTYWFISETDRRRKLKVVFMAWRVEVEPGKTKIRTEIKSAFEPSADDLANWERHGKC